MDKIDEIVRGLTKAQREAMASARWIHPGGQDPICLVKFTDPWRDPLTYFFTIDTDRLTPLGLAVRARLEEQDNEH